MIARLGFLFVLLCVACDSETETAFCDDAPVLTWDNFGADYILHNCQTCHASTTADRHDAPEDVTFDTHAEVLNRAERILERITSTEDSMPPSGGINEDEQWRAEVWLRCFME